MRFEVKAQPGSLIVNPGAPFFSRLAVRRPQYKEGRGKMRKKFQLNYRHSNGDLFINLTGEFDGMCAWELIKTINRKKTGSGRIFIDTNGLIRTAASGLELFKSHMSERKMPPDWLYFKGEKGFRMAPDGSRVIIFKNLNECQRRRLESLAP